MDCITHANTYHYKKKGKQMKKKLVTAVLICAFILSGCNSAEKDEMPQTEESLAATGSTEASEQNDDKKSEETTEETTAENAEQADSEKPSNLYTPDGAKVDPNELSDIEYYEDGNWSYALINGTTFLAEPTGYCYNSIDTPEEMSAVEENGASENLTFEYKRYKVGDVVMGLTIAEASSTFRNDSIIYVGEDGNEYTQEQLAEKGSYFSGTDVTFDGQVTMNGYLEIMVDDDYGIEKGDIYFIPSPDSEKIPIAFFNSFSPSKGFSANCMSGYSDGFTWRTEYPNIMLGNKESADFDFSGFEEGKYIPVTVTADRITISSTTDWLSKITGHIISCTLR